MNPFRHAYLVLLSLTAILASGESAMTPSFADLARRAEAGEHLTVVFLGGSLTWGANGTDPERTSYRAHIARRLAARWPKARWNCVDAALGGTGSRLAVFRLPRDVARHRPDLVFIDHTCNDGGAGPADPDRLASCEAVVRACVADLHVPSVMMILAAGSMVTVEDIDRLPIRMAHLGIAKAYGCPVGDTVERIHQGLRSGKLRFEDVWDNPKDRTHPGDAGYALYADVAWSALEGAIASGTCCAAPERMIHADTYRNAVRVPLTSLVPLPTGWVAGKPSRVGAAYDFYMSRWLDSVAVAERGAGAAEPGAWELRVHGATVLLFGESTATSGKLRVLIDGRPAREFADGILDCRCSGTSTIRLDATLATVLEAGVEHLVRLEPFSDRPGPAEWRIESICVAGAGAQVRP